MEPNKEQHAALKIIKGGTSVFITGPAGTGKTELLNFFIRRQQQIKKKRVGITASTGCAAILIQGTTLHSFLGLPIDGGDIDPRADKLKNWTGVDILIIDEVSMIPCQLFEKIDDFAKKIRNDNRFFGGIQLLLCGDFLQLPVVRKKKWEKIEFLFNSDLWKDNITTIYLQTVIRQDNKEFVSCLNSLRLVNINQNIINLLKQRTICSLKDLPTNEEIKPTIIFSKNIDVDKYNLKEVSRLETPIKKYVMTLNNKNFTNMAETLCLAEKAQVMLLVNHDISKGLINGSRGIITGFSNGLPKVKFRNGIEIVVDRVTRFHESNINEFVTQIPLKLAYAITVHKSQGLSLDFVLVDLNDVFDYGQGYVALSRARSLESLYILNFSEKAFFHHKDALSFYYNKSF